MRTLTLELDERRRRLLQNALDHWTPAVKRIRSRVKGMGYREAAELIEPDTDLLEGTDTDVGLIARLDPQEDLFDQDDAEGPAITLEGRELRLCYYALRKHRERIQKLRTDIHEEGYSTDDIEQDLEVLGRTADPDEGEPSTGLIGEVDFGWEQEEDPDQMELGEPGAPAGAGSEPAEAEVDDDLADHIRAFCRRRMDEREDIEVAALKEEVEEEFPDAGIEDLTLRQFHARYPLQVKRQMVQERKEGED
jgi:hypothetical protein